MTWKQSYSFDGEGFSALLEHDGRLQVMCPEEEDRVTIDDDGKVHSIITISADQLEDFHVWLNASIAKVRGE
jgi:hypothetical protein